MEPTTQELPKAPEVITMTSDALRAFGESLLQEARKVTSPAAAPQLAPQVQMGRSWEKSWQRRAVARLNHLSAAAKGDHDATLQHAKRFAELSRDVNDMTLELEQQEAYDMIKKAGLTVGQEARLMSSLTTGAGGALVLPAPLLAQIFILMEQYGQARQLFRAIPMVTDTLKLDSLTTDALAYWVTQGNRISASDLVFTQAAMTVNKLAGVSSWSHELDEDQLIALLPIFTDSMARAIYTKEDQAAFLGDGTAAFGGFTGLLNASGNVYTMPTTNTTFDKITLDFLRSVRDAVPASKRRSAMWFMHFSILSYVEGMKTTYGDYIFRQPTGELPPTLWGYPIAGGMNGITVMPSSAQSAVSKLFVAFGDPSNVLFGQRRNLELVMSKEGIIDNGTDVLFNALTMDGTIARLTERISIQCMNTSGFAALKTSAT